MKPTVSAFVLCGALAAFGGCEQGREPPAAEPSVSNDATGSGSDGITGENLAAPPAGDPTGATAGVDSGQGGRTSAAAGEQTAPADDPAAMPKDVAFAREAAMDGQLEVEAGRLAAERGSERTVKQFGTMMLRDHSEANQELMRVAQSKGIALPRELNEEQGAVLDRLHGLAGPEFDREYGALTVRAHIRGVNMFEEQARSGQDPELRAYARRTLAKLRQHLEAARELPGAGG